ncbi:MAG TPA: DNA/RNA nuclease SfsA [Holophagaceae bacterium]|nr:DNA/RNA nuclease SfsA [Holophagaceae bacterium]
MALIEKRGLVPGRIVQRYKRFLADVELEDGRIVTAHCTNTGSMKSCFEPGDRVLLEPAANPERKLKYTWLACEREGRWLGVETGMPNRVVAEAARRDAIPGLSGLRGVRTEVKYGLENSRIDVLAQDGEGRQVFIEVKNTTLREGAFVLFPDAVSERGAKHLRELRGMVEAGHRAAIAFFVHRTDVEAFDAARAIDPAYAAELDRAAGAGVQVLPLQVGLEAGPEPGPEAEGAWTLAWDLAGLLPWKRR